MAAGPTPEELVRELAPQVLGALVRRYGHFDESEDAVQEALLAAAVRWPEQGVPANPRAWLITVASRRLTDQLRAETARRRRETTAAGLVPPDEQVGPGADVEPEAERDDELTLFFLCCHPALSPVSQAALTLRAVGGLTTSEIASAYLVPEVTMAQRIVRAKQRIKATGVPFRLPDGAEREDRLGVVLHVLYLIFNEGYVATSGPDLHRTDLVAEAQRLTRAVRRLLPDDAEVAGLLALMLLTDARRPARTRADGALIPLGEQDRGDWDASAIAEGVALITETLSRGRPGPYQVQAAIAALHDEAPSSDDTDWPQILALYRVLEGFSSSPAIKLNQAVALAKVEGPQAALDLLEGLEADGRLAGHHRLDAVRAHVLEMAGEREAAGLRYRAAAAGTRSLPERRYLEERAARLTAEPPLHAKSGRCGRP
jgi:RNA polymerase sigma factor (sigma-70 family)